MKFALVALLFLSGSILVACNGGPLEELISGGSGEGHESGSGGIGGSKSGGESSLLGGDSKTSEKTGTAGGSGILGLGGLDNLYKDGFLGAKGPAEIIKLLLSPVEFCKRVAKHYKLRYEKFILLLKKGATFGLEVALQPALLTFKIMEKIFVPDACKLKLICKYAHPLSFTKEHLPKFSSKFLDSSHIVKAMNDGLHGHDCEVIYSGCGKNGSPKLKKEYEQHNTGSGNGNGNGNHEHHGSGSHDHNNGSHEHGNHEHGENHENGAEQYESSNIHKTLKSANTKQ